jgi:hypothetical protein
MNMPPSHEMAMAGAQNSQSGRSEPATRKIAFVGQDSLINVSISHWGMFDIADLELARIKKQAENPYPLTGISAQIANGGRHAD